MSGLPVIEPDWPTRSSIVAYTSTRQGGVSEGVYASLNVGDHVGDEPVCVAQNRCRLPYADRLNWLNQVHSDQVVTVPARRCDADAIISRTPGEFCAVMTADCVPILVSNLMGTEVAAIHAGWKGLDKGIIANTINAMHSSAKQLTAWIGPAICVNHYEVDAALAQRFSSVPMAVQNADCDKAQLDLPAIAAWQLKHCGVGAVTQSGICTYSDSQRFFSHRRAMHEGLSSTGRIVSVIGIAK